MVKDHSREQEAVGLSGQVSYISALKRRSFTTPGVIVALAYAPPQDETNSRALQESLATLQAAVGGYIEAVAVPADETLILLVNEDGLWLNLPPNPQASAVALRSIVGDAVLMPRTLLC